MASLPKAVQAQLEAAEAVMKQTSNEGLTPNQGGSDSQPEASEAKPVEALQQQEPTTQAVEQPKVEAQQAKPQQDVWESRYKALQGLFNKEVPALQATVKELQARIREMEQAHQAAKEPPKPQTVSVDPQDVEAFGSDLVDMVQRVAQQVLQSAAAKIDGVVAQFEKRLVAVETALNTTTQTVAVTAEDTFFSRLTAKVPDWEQVNSDERFLAWLGEVDPMLGKPRQAALDAAHQALDVERTAAIFSAFKATLPPKQTKTSASIEKQVSPSSASSAPVSPTDKPVITSAQIQNFYAEVAKGKYRGREAEAARLEQMINQAIAEGRVR